MLSGIDYFVVVAYLIGIMLLGPYFRKFVRSSRDFFLAGKVLIFDVELVELFRVHRRRRIVHQRGGPLCFWKRDDVADRIAGIAECA